MHLELGSSAPEQVIPVRIARSFAGGELDFASDRSFHVQKDLMPHGVFD
jgi:hypothetical protein